MASNVTGLADKPMRITWDLDNMRVPVTG